jgi:PAS domain S-box-containing protein
VLFNDGFARHEIFPGKSEMSSLMRHFAWGQTSLGPVDTWPQSLKTVARILLTSRYAMWMGWGPDLTFLYNDRYGQMTLGKKHPWALGKPAHEVWREIWRDIGPRIQKVLDTGEATWDEALQLFLERSGYPEETYHTFSYSPLLGDDGMVMGMLCVVTEETERIIGERRLRSLRTIASELGTAITESDLLLRIEKSLSQSQRDLPFTLTYLLKEDGGARLACRTGLEAGHVAAPLEIGPEGNEVTWPYAELLSKNRLLAVENLAERFGNLPTGVWERPSERAVLVPLQKQGQSDAAGFFVAGLNPYRQLDAEYSGFIELTAGQIAAGLSNARAYEDERRRAELLAEVDRAKTAFFTNISHEFRTPLTLMLGPLEQSIDRLGAGSSLAVEEAEQLRIVHRNGLRLLKLVNALLDFSRIEAGRAQVRFEAVDLGSFTAELASMFRSATEKAGLQLIVDCPPLEEKVYADPDMWEKIVLNLLSNAFKFTLEGSIRVRLTREYDHIRLDVADTGVGIAPEHLPRVFERFHRIDGTAGRTIEGTGIGLALVHQLVRLQRGSIHVESAPDRGTTFTVRLPASTARPVLAPMKSDLSLGPSPRASDYVAEAMQWLPERLRSSTPTGHSSAIESGGSESAERTPFRVFVVDDNADMQDYLRRLLSQHWTVEVFGSGPEALSAAIANPPHLIITDVMMPELDGFGLVKALRESPATSRVPIIMLSARAGEEARIEGLQAGVENYLVKPFSARELLESVKAQLLLRQRSAQFETLVNSAPIGIIVVDGNFRFRQVNPLAVPVFGRSTNIIGSDFVEAVRKMWTRDYADELLRIFRHTLETGEPYSNPKAAEFRVDRQQTEYYEWRVDRISLPEGAFGVVCYFRDISLQVKAEEALRQSEKLAVVGRMAASISHEINNPLEAVTNLLYLIRSCTDAEQLETYLNVTEQELARVNGIVTHGLRFHRQSTTPREERISELLESAAAIYQGRLHNGPVQLVRRFRDTASVWALGGELRQVFANVVGNAFDATLSGGKIILRTRDAVDAATRRSGVRVTIADSGIGMSAETKSRLFEPFFTTKNVAGTGLGLWLSKEILERHGASLRVKSRNSGSRTGTVFSIFFPATGVTSQGSATDARQVESETLRISAG